MEKIDVKIGWTGDNYSCIAEDIALNGIVLVTCNTLEDIKKKFQESLQFHIDGCVQDGDEMPEWLIYGKYDLNYMFEKSALIHSFNGSTERKLATVV